MSLPFNNVDNTTGDVTLQEGYFTTIKLSISEIARVLSSDEFAIHLGHGKKFLILPTEDDDVMYCVKVYERDMSVRSNFRMTGAEWDCVVSHATNITFPPVHDEICTFCGDHVPGTEHYGCEMNKRKIEAFVLTTLGERLTAALVKATTERYEAMMVGEEYGINYTILKRAYAYIKRQTIVDLLPLGKGDTLNENILHYDTHFINFKFCAYSHIIDIIDHDLGGDLQQSLDM